MNKIKYNCVFACLITNDIILIDYDNSNNAVDLIELLNNTLLLGVGTTYDIGTGVYTGVICIDIADDNSIDISLESIDKVTVEIDMVG